MTQSSFAHQGLSAALLGGQDAANNSTIAQTVVIDPGAGCFYMFSFFADIAQLDPAAVLTAELFWLDAVGNQIEQGLFMVIKNTNNFANTYTYYLDLSNQVPVGAVRALVLFTKSGPGSVLLDDVSLLAL